MTLQAQATKTIYLVEVYLALKPVKHLAHKWLETWDEAVDEGYEYMECYFFSDLNEGADVSYKNLVINIIELKENLEIEDHANTPGEVVHKAYKEVKKSVFFSCQ